MCFSAGASFGASAVLGTIGVISVKKTAEPRQRPFAMIPLIFGVQQLSEGMLWLGLSDSAYAGWSQISVYIFLIFAQLIWPVWIPFSLFLMEKDPLRRRILRWLLVMGLTISIYLLYCMFRYPVFAEIRSGHIYYALQFPAALSWISSILYFIPTVVSLFISGVKRMPVLGAALLISFLLTRIFFEDFLISVWCFFAGMLSLVVLSIVTTYKRALA